MEGVYIFPSASKQNILLGIKLGLWAVPLQKKNKPSMLGKARSMSIGDWVMLYLTGKKKLFYGIFRVTELPDEDRVVSDVWNGDFELPFKFALCEEQEEVSTLRAPDLMNVLPSLKNASGAWSDHVTKYGAMTIFQKQPLSEGDMKALVAKFATRSRPAEHQPGPSVELAAGPTAKFTLPEEVPPNLDRVVEAESPLADGDSVPPSPPLQAQDLEAPPASRGGTTVSRIVRDTQLSNRVKALHKYECQICGHTLFLPDGRRYAEGHHVRPLGAPHDGPDVRENILCLCPNHHAACDLGAIMLSVAELRQATGHTVGQRYVDYHNRQLFRGS